MFSSHAYQKGDHLEIARILKARKTMTGSLRVDDVDQVAFEDERRKKIDSRLYLGHTPLHLAAEGGHLQAVKVS